MSEGKICSLLNGVGDSQSGKKINRFDWFCYFRWTMLSLIRGRWFMKGGKCTCLVIQNSDTKLAQNKNPISLIANTFINKEGLQSENSASLLKNE
jgi:hypothetical protein